MVNMTEPVRLLLFCSLFLAACIDLRDRKIPNCFLKYMIRIGFILHLAECGRSMSISCMKNAIYGLFLGGGIFFLCYLLSKGGIGAGDVKLMATTGFCAGYTEMKAIMILSVFLAGAVCMGIVVMGKGGRKIKIPFAPFVWGAFVLTLLLRK